MGQWPQNQAFDLVIPRPWPNPYWKCWVSWTGEWTRDEPVEDLDSVLRSGLGFPALYSSVKGQDSVLLCVYMLCAYVLLLVIQSFCLYIFSITQHHTYTHSYIHKHVGAKSLKLWQFPELRIKQSYVHMKINDLCILLLMGYTYLVFLRRKLRP